MFAVDRAVRVGDMLETLFLMAIFGEWNHTNAEGEAKELDEAELDEIYVKGRLRPVDLDAFPGSHLGGETSTVPDLQWIAQQVISSAVAKRI